VFMHAAQRQATLHFGPKLVSFAMRGLREAVRMTTHSTLLFSCFEIFESGDSAARRETRRHRV
jgi:hypothetical protein